MPVLTTLIEPDPSEYLFESQFEARRACLNSVDLLHHIDSYETEMVEAYYDYIQEVRLFLSQDTTTHGQCEALYPVLRQLGEKLSLKRGDTGRVYITTSEEINRSEYVTCQIGVVPAEGEEGEEISYRNCEIRIRGNSTSVGPKFPYTFKLPYGDSLFGMDSGKRWNLMANLFDRTLMRSNIALNLALELGAPYSCQTTYVEVFLNGQYLGNYELTEAISDSRNRVDVDTEDNEYILEVDWNRNESPYYVVTPALGLRFKVDRPEEVSGAQMTWLEDFLAEAEAALTEDSDRYKTYFDLDSFVNVYLVLEYTKCLDGNNLSTRYHIKDNVIYAGPVWDFDLSAGNASPGTGEEGYLVYLNTQGRGDDSGDSTRGLWANAGWIGALLEREEFLEAVKARYSEVRPLLENVFADNELGQSRIGSLQEQYGDSFRRNYTEGGWDIMAVYSPYPMDPEGRTYEEHVAFLTGWYRDRLAYLDTVYLE